MSDAVNPNPSNGGDAAEPTPISETPTPPPPPPPLAEVEGSSSEAADDEGALAADTPANGDDAQHADGVVTEAAPSAVAAGSDACPAAAVEADAASPLVEDVDDDEDDDEDDEGEEDDDEDEDDQEELGVNEFLNLLPPAVLPRVEHLRSLDAQRDDVLDDYKKERAIMEKKFALRMKPLYDERRDVVAGLKDAEIEKEASDKKSTGSPDAGGEGAVGGGGGEVASEEGGGAAEPDAKGVPQFWACAMGHVDVIAELITEADVDCLDFLMDVTCNDFEDGSGFELVFHFSEENTYFKNRTLSKRYEVPNLLTEDEPILKNVSGTDIDWREGRSLTYREVTKKQRKKGGRAAGQIRTVTKRERTDSLFHFFSPPEMPDARDVMDEEEADAVEDSFDHDYDVAQAFRGHLIPRAIKWFTGEALEDFDDEMADEMMGDDDNDEDGDGGNGGPGPVKFNFEGAPAPGPFPPPAQGDGENPECKQN